MRCLTAVLVLLALAPAAHACGIRTSALRGAAPLVVHFRTTCPSRLYRWQFGDGNTGVGAKVAHLYRGGRFPPTVHLGSGRLPLVARKAPALSAVPPPAEP